VHRIKKWPCRSSLLIIAIAPSAAAVGGPALEVSLVVLFVEEFELDLATFMALASDSVGSTGNKEVKS
jgi:hypothetical protein